MLPGEADTAEDLDGGVTDRSQSPCESLGPQCRQMTLGGAAASAAHSAWTTPLRASSTVSYMSTHKCCTAWKLPMAWPNCLRTFAYSTARFITVWAAPSASAA